MRGLLITENKVLRFSAFLLLAISNGQAQERTFSMPDSVLLFGNYDQGLILKTPQQSSTLGVPSGASRTTPVAIASLGLRGEHIAWGFPVADHRDKKSEVRCTVGVYSVPEQKWRTYGDFSAVLTTAISPDESRIAFNATQGSGTKVKHSAFLLDIGTGAISELTQDASGFFSWSPDGRRLAVGSGIIDVPDPTGANSNLFEERHYPAWSPSGEWIAYIDASEQSIHLVHPDGTSDHVIKSVRNHLFGHRFFALRPIWSPDSAKLLLNEYKADGDTLDVVLLEISSGKTITKSKNGNPILGWANQHK
jgi:hypothetical protein